MIGYYQPGKLYVQTKYKTFWANEYFSGPPEFYLSHKPLMLISLTNIPNLSVWLVGKRLLYSTATDINLMKRVDET